MENLLLNDTSFDSLLDDVIIYLFDNNLTLSEIIRFRLLSRKYKTLIDRFYQRYRFNYERIENDIFIFIEHRTCVLPFSVHNQVESYKTINYFIDAINENIIIDERPFRDGFIIYGNHTDIKISISNNKLIIYFEDEGYDISLSFDVNNFSYKENDEKIYYIFDLKNNRLEILRFLYFIRDIIIYNNLFDRLIKRKFLSNGY